MSRKVGETLKHLVIIGDNLKSLCDFLFVVKSSPVTKVAVLTNSLSYKDISTIGKVLGENRKLVSSEVYRFEFTLSLTVMEDCVIMSSSSLPSALEIARLCQ